MILLKMITVADTTHPWNKELSNCTTTQRKTISTTT